MHSAASPSERADCEGTVTKGHDVRLQVNPLHRLARSLLASPLPSKFITYPGAPARSLAFHSSPVESRLSLRDVIIEMSSQHTNLEFSGHVVEKHARS